MKSRYFRIFLITAIPLAIASGLNYWLDIESSLGLDTLFTVRGVRQPPDDVVIIAMDEASEMQLGLGQDLTAWRGFHAHLIEQLQVQGVKLIAFDLQFLLPQPEVDAKFASAIANVGNVLTVECVQKLRRATEDFFGRDECSESNKLPFVESQEQIKSSLSEAMIAMRRLPPLPQIAEAALDHAPVYLAYDSNSSVVREVWIYLDALGELPNLPLVAWLYWLQFAGDLQAVLPPGQPLSVWLTQQRRDCLDGHDQAILLGIDDARLSRRLRRLICSGDSRYLDFYGPQKTLRMESYSDVYFGKVRDLKDKVVFVGKANRKFSPGRTDYFATPFRSGGKTAGVEILATEFSNLLEDRFVEMPLSPLVFGCGYGLLVAMLLVLVGGVAGIAWSTLFSGIYAGVAVWYFNSYGLWLPLAVPILLQLPLSTLLSFIWSRRDLLRERTRMMSYVDQVFPRWLDSVPNARPWLGDEQAVVDMKRVVWGLCLATDIEGYTAVAARKSSQLMWSLLNDYYQALGKRVDAHDGIVVDVTGDAMMAVWLQDDAEDRHAKACRAALAMVKAVDVFNRQAGDEALPTRVGLHEGDLTLGPVDVAKGIYYRAIGDTVNTASRIQGVNKYLNTRILATATIAQDLHGIDYRSVGLFRMIGRETPVELVEIVGLAGEISPQKYQQFELFQQGLTAFQHGDWPLAIRRLQAALYDFGNDGPSRFYLALADEHQKRPPEQWDGIVTLDAK